MRMIKFENFNLFSQPVSALLEKTEGKHVHLYWTDEDGYCLGCNSYQEELLKRYNKKLAKERSIVNLHLTEIISLGQGVIPVLLNTDEVLQTSKVKMFVEYGWGRACWSIKAPLFNCCGRVIGVGGVSFYFDEISLPEITKTINDLRILPAV